MNIEGLYNQFLRYGRVTTDSRKFDKNALFFALKGEKFNGNRYAKDAIKNGCSFAIIDEKEYKLNDNFILVDNVLETLQSLANCHRKKLNISIVAITGTNGKTTTKELVSKVLGQKYNVCSTVGNLNNHIGVPLTLLSMNNETEIGVVEMGANHMNEIKTLCEIAEPNYGIITNIGKAHLEGFGSFENIIKTKSELYNYIEVTGGKIFYNEKNNILKEQLQKLSADVIAFNAENSKVNGSIAESKQFLELKLKIENDSYNVKTNLIGSYNLENILVAATVGNYFKVENKNILSAIEAYIPTNNRSQFIQTKTNNLYLDAYNANPTSVLASLENFKSLNFKNSTLILGDMLELGKETKSEHLKIIEQIENINVSKLILVGDIYSSISLDEEILQFVNVEDLINWLKNNELCNSNILIKGSRGIQLEKVVEFL